MPSYRSPRSKSRSRPSTRSKTSSFKSKLMRHRKKIALGAALTAALAGSAYGAYRYRKHHNVLKAHQANFPMSSPMGLRSQFPIANRVYSAKNSFLNLFKKKQEGGKKRRGPGRPRRVGRPKSHK